MGAACRSLEARKEAIGGGKRRKLIFISQICFLIALIFRFLIKKVLFASLLAKGEGEGSGSERKREGNWI